MWTRRELLQTLGMAGVFPAVARATLCDAGPSAGTTDRPAVLAEIRRRAEAELRQRRLVVDYYRIGRKLAYPLPVPRLIAPDIPAEGLGNYPWGTWLLWRMEERINALGRSGQFLGDLAAREAVLSDLAALAEWPDYGRLTLSSAHAGRILWTALAHWPWISAALAARLRQAAGRQVEVALASSEKSHGAIRDKSDVLKRADPHSLLSNISLIATAGTALAAAASGHPAAARLNARLKALFGAVLELRGQGFSEGVAYDGYVLDFMADWLGLLPEAERAALLDHRHFGDYLDQSSMLAAPGAADAVAELGDVEPRQMPFHLSAQAKLLHLRPSGLGAWLLAGCRLDVLRADALAAIHSLGRWPTPVAPRAGALDAHYALVLRSGWQADDLAVAVSCSRSPMGHLHHDGGSLVIGTQGRWLITDPGYQQYAKGDERQFTVGPAAHNAPVINGVAQTQKRARRIVLEAGGPGLWHVAVDLAACYSPSLGLQSLVRHVWLAEQKVVVVADRHQTASPPRMEYHWHGHPAADWWIDAGAALVELDGVRLWITSPQTRIVGANLDRLPGSRGQLTLSPTVERAPATVWWVFALGPEPPTVNVEAGGRELRLGAHVFRV